MASDETSRHAASAHEMIGLKEKVRVIDDEFSKRVKALESVIQRLNLEFAERQQSGQRDVTDGLA
jgi:hypothetical protein